MIRLYTDTSHYNKSSRKELIALLRPFIGENRPRPVEENKEKYGMSQEDYQIVYNVAESDVAVLPMSWNYYYDKKITDKAWAFVNQAAMAGKKVISWTSGDFGITPPYHKAVYVFRPSGYDDKFPPNHLGLPIFITDPVKQYFNKEDVTVLKSPDNEKKIGFCGLANVSKAKHIKEWWTIGFRNLKYAFKLSHNDPQALSSSTALRCKVLDKLEHDKSLKTNFIKRDKYRAGSVTDKERETTAIEYFENIMNSDFVLCIRGNGNFSVRFYECLAMGRIPLLLNTHSPLPDIAPLKWSDHIIMANINEVGGINQKIETFLHGKDIMKQRVSNRKLFLNYLANGPFWTKSVEKLININ